MVIGDLWFSSVDPPLWLQICACLLSLCVYVWLYIFLFHQSPHRHPPVLFLPLSSELTEPLGPAAPAEPAVPSQPVEIEIETPEIARKRQQK